MSLKIVTYGQVAYEAYCAAGGGKSLVSGAPLPAWDEQDERIRVAWNRAGAAVCDDIIGDGLPGSELAAMGKLHDELAEERSMRLHLATEVNELREERDKAYRERARLVAYLSAIYPAELAPAESDSGAWWLVFVETPAGQMSWHLHEDDLELFPHLLNRPETGVEWDGHTTEVKYGRLARLTGALATGIYGARA